MVDGSPCDRRCGASTYGSVCDACNALVCSHCGKTRLLHLEERCGRGMYHVRCLDGRIANAADFQPNDED